MRNCVTHHYACDCREEKIQALLQGMLTEHKELRKFSKGFAYRGELCGCLICDTILEIYPELRKEVKSDMKKGNKKMPKKPCK